MRGLAAILFVACLALVFMLQRVQSSVSSLQKDRMSLQQKLKAAEEGSKKIQKVVARSPNEMFWVTESEPQSSRSYVKHVRAYKRGVGVLWEMEACVPRYDVAWDGTVAILPNLSPVILLVGVDGKIVSRIPYTTEWEVRGIAFENHLSRNVLIAYKDITDYTRTVFVRYSVDGDQKMVKTVSAKVWNDFTADDHTILIQDSREPLAVTY